MRREHPFASWYDSHWSDGTQIRAPSIGRYIIDCEDPGRIWVRGSGCGSIRNALWLFRHLPQRIRLERAKKVLGPAGGWWLKDRVVGRVPILLGHSVRSSEARGDRAALQLSDRDGKSLDWVTDHVIAATGYRFQLRRLPFLTEDLKSRLRNEEQLPVLSANFESSVPGLYFAGLASCYSFGPAMRFLAGAGFAARRISRHLAAARHAHMTPSAVRFAAATTGREFSDLHAPPRAKRSEASG